MLGMVAATMTVALGGTTWASGPKSGGHPVASIHNTIHPVTAIHNTIHPIHPVTPIHNTIHPVFPSNYQLTHGHQFSHGFYFQGREFRHFQYRHWNSNYRCWTFYYPGTSSYYYWSGFNGCFYPMNYAPVVAPNGVLPEGIDTLPDEPMPMQTQGM